MIGGVYYIGSSLKPVPKDGGCGLILVEGLASNFHRVCNLFE